MIPVPEKVGKNIKSAAVNQLRKNNFNKGFLEKQ